MTFLEAITALEAKIDKLDFRWPDNSPMSPIEKTGALGEFFGERYDKVIGDLYDGNITVDAYFIEMIKMIRDYTFRDREPF